MFTRCARCRKKIEFGNSHCDDCKKVILKSKKDTLRDKEAEKALKTTTWKNVRASVIRRDGGVCKLCLINGIVEYRNLQVHHIVKRTQNLELAYDTSNLVTLCRTCHEKMEPLPTNKQKELLGELEEKVHYLL